MTGFLLRAVFAGLGLWLASRIVPGVSASGWQSVAIAAVLLGIVNAVVRPVVIVLTLPITLVTLGLFLLVVNAAMLGLVAMVLPGLAVHGFWAGIFGAIVIGIVSWFGHLLLGEAGERD
ncbi:phage holin family protein [Caulobacter hibisci]|uniref:Phage holin family protein n=1 Tax=Caulobacter hibisci TaxID=2035993 RepID=A0ABS0SYW0_9CAUL|nr:phage holin family protein [Caulobacter hibisci]MBI1684629.1 phage holin family protein [Caulobacter hibisci]